MSVRLIPLGGFDRIGLNMTVVENDDTILVIDCGRSFASDNLPGVDTSIPDIEYLFKNREKIRGILLTHGHEDHIGALPYVLSRLDAPVTIYGLPLTIGLAEEKLKQSGMRSSDKKAKLKTVRIGQTIRLGSMHVEFIHVNHSVPDSAALAVFTPDGVIIHTGDFKIDYTPIFEQPADLRRLAMLGYKGVLALVTDSTNALVGGVSPSEVRVADAIRKLFAENRSGRILISTFTSNIDRIRAIVQIAKENGRKCAFIGNDMRKVLEIADRLRYFDLSDEDVIDPAMIMDLPAEQVAVIIEDMQGRDHTIMEQIAEGTYTDLMLREGDTVILSTIPLPGSEKLYSRTLGSLEQRGAKVAYQDVHASGHACVEELKQIYTLIGPKYVIPAHGEYRYRMANAQIAADTGIPREDIFLIDNGEVLELSEEAGKIIGDVKAKEIYVDGSTVGDTGRLVLEERQRLAESGIVVVQAVFSKTGQLLTEPSVFTKGFVFENDSEELLREMKSTVIRSMYRSSERERLDYSRLRGSVRSGLADFLWDKVGRKPVILVIFSTVG